MFFLGQKLYTNVSCLILEIQSDDCKDGEQVCKNWSLCPKSMLIMRQKKKNEGKRCELCSLSSCRAARRCQGLRFVSQRAAQTGKYEEASCRSVKATAFFWCYVYPATPVSGYSQRHVRQKHLPAFTRTLSDKIKGWLWFSRMCQGV